MTFFIRSCKPCGKPTVWVVIDHLYSIAFCQECMKRVADLDLLLGGKDTIQQG